MRAGVGSDFDVRLFPLPVQKDPAGVVDVYPRGVFRRARARLGAGVLAYLMNQSVDELAAQDRQIPCRVSPPPGHDPARAHVTVLVHTFLG